MAVLLAVNLLFTLFLGIAWKREDIINLFIKVFVLSLCLANLIAVLYTSGYIVKR